MRPPPDDSPPRLRFSGAFDENIFGVDPRQESDLTALADQGGGLKLPGEDKAVSEWETEAEDDDCAPPTKITPQPNKCTRLAVQAHDPLRRSTRPGHPSPNTLLAHTARSTEDPFHCSSIYSTVSKDEHPVDQPPGRIDYHHQEQDHPQPPPDTLWPRRSPSGGGKTNWSKTSSSVSMERFKYDRGLYSTLMSSIDREPPKRINPGPELTTTNSDMTFYNPAAIQRVSAAQCPVPTNDDQDGDADWQTITTERPRETIREIELNFARGAGSSLADVSDTSADGVHNAQLDGISAKAGHLTESTLDHFGLVTARQRDQHAQAYDKTGAKPSQPGQVLQMPQLPTRAAEAIRRFSNPFRQDHGALRRERPGNSFEMAKLSNSYESLDSEPTETGAGQPGGRGRRYAFTQKKLDQEPPKLPSVLFDRRSNWPSFRQSSGYGGEGLTQRDTLLGDTSRLPFPLISLPEAAQLQSFRRERGEEDHTDPPGFFAAKVRSARSATVSTMSSVNSPMTPLSAYVEWQTHMSARGNGKPPVACHGRDPSRQPRSLSPTPVRSPSPLGGTGPKSGRKLFGEDVSDSSSIIEARILRLRGFALSAREMQVAIAHESPELYTRSEIELVETGRGRASLGAPPGPKSTSLKLLFVGIRVGTLVFPLVGILALCGQFDSTISWYSRGQRHSLLTRQRFVLKRQLLMELVMYSVLIAALAVYYSLHGQRTDV
ncbi:hypothetical protein XA68_10043 [Ophiocordyceps unilateralis]|uniref:Uncharacterized protein n=1 Tax=Ophiocordyceps unilateralis TaxID=268505 RepID=A0A2A9PTT2_OPHUN|nr:hypothetical protein XA68_10043 [Ophiocordyceps unilateralis]